MMHAKGAEFRVTGQQIIGPYSECSIRSIRIPTEILMLIRFPLHLERMEKERPCALQHETI